MDDLEMMAIAVGMHPRGKPIVTLTDSNPTKVVGAGGGYGLVTLTDTNPSKVVGSGGGRGNVTLTDTNPTVGTVIT